MSVADALIDLDGQNAHVEGAMTTKPNQYPLNEEGEQHIDMPLSTMRYDGNVTSGKQSVAMLLQ
jgi:hypothetical protein